MCKIIISAGAFFNFNFLIFWVVRGMKGQKMTGNSKNVCLLHLIFSGTIYHMMFIYRTDSFFFFFFFFSNFWFSGLLVGRRDGGKRAKNSSKWQKSFVCLSSYFRNSTSNDYDFWYTCLKWWYLQQIFSFSTFWC